MSRDAMRVAAIDIGTNSVLLLVAERRHGGALVPIYEIATITRLGEGVDATRALAPAAVERTLACLRDYGERLRSLGAERVDAVGTSAMRDAAGGRELVERAREVLGTAPRVVSGDEEARLTFEGALVGLTLRAGPVSVFDVGGGSTEVIVAAGASAPTLEAGSVDVGSVRLTERHLHDDPPSPAQLEAARADARGALGDAPLPRGTLVGVAGTVTTLAAIARGIDPYDGARVHGSELSSHELKALLGRLASVPLAERRTIPGLEPKRADVIVGGAIVVDELLARAGAPSFIVSDRGVRWGLAARLAARA